jgi:hypothetical protein
MIRNAIVITSALPKTNLLQENSTDLFDLAQLLISAVLPYPTWPHPNPVLQALLPHTLLAAGDLNLVSCATDFRTGSSAAVDFLPRIPTLLMNITRRSSNAFQLPGNQDLKFVTALTWSSPACFFKFGLPDLCSSPQIPQILPTVMAPGV